MRKIIIGLLWIVALVALLNMFNYKYSKSLNEIDSLMNNFEDNNLLDASGNIVLDSIKEKEELLKNEVFEAYNEKRIDINEYIDFTNNQDNELLDNNEITKLYNKVNELKNKKNSLKIQYDVLNLKYTNMVNNSNKSNSHIIKGVPVIYQYPKYPTGCESVALTILLRFHGYDITVDDVIRKLKLGDLPHEENATTYGGNPELEFIGSPYNGDSYGVYNLPIGNVAAEFSNRAKVQSGLPFGDVLKLIDEGRPVVVWTSMNLAMPYISRSWIYKPTGETIYWRAQEHAVVVIGYDGNNVIISDPISGSIKYQNRDLFESRYNYYGKRAVYL